MSIKIMAQVFALPEPTGSARLVLLALADNANDAGICWPGMSTIASKAAVSRSTVIRMVAELEQAGFIERIRRPNTSNMYKILPEKGGCQIDTSVTHDTTPSVTHDTRIITLTVNKEPSLTDDSFSVACHAYESNIGPLTPMLGDAIQQALKDYTTAWVVDAIGVAVRAGVRRWQYVEGVLRRWKVEGRKDTAPGATGTKTKLDPFGR